MFQETRQIPTGRPVLPCQQVTVGKISNFAFLHLYNRGKTHTVVDMELIKEDGEWKALCRECHKITVKQMAAI